MKIKVTYQDYACFDIRTCFQRQPTLFACPMCAGLLETRDVAPSVIGRDLLEQGTIPVIHFTRLLICDSCQWWALREEGEDCEFYNLYDYLVTGVVRKWEHRSSKHSLIAGLNEYCKKHEDRLDGFNPKAIERLIARCLRSETVHGEVRHLGVAGWQEDDLTSVYLIKDETEWLVQLRHRLTEDDQRFELIRILNGVLLQGGQPRGLVVTSNATAADEARAVTARERSKTYSVRLADDNKVFRMDIKAPLEQLSVWRTALDDKEVWNRPHHLSEEYASLFLSTEGHPPA